MTVVIVGTFERESRRAAVADEVRSRGGVRGPMFVPMEDERGPQDQPPS